MFKTKPLPEKGIEAALEKAERYRLLNDALAAESICLDVLEVDPDHQQAVVMLLLALTDQFAQRQSKKVVSQARDLLPRIKDESSRTYYEAIIFERRAKASLQRGGMNSGSVAYDLFQRAMELFEKCDPSSGKGTEATLRWNTCARILNLNPDVVPAKDEPVQDMLE